MAQTGIVVAMRRLMMVLAVVSLLMSAGIAVVWVRSYWRGDEFVWGACDGQVIRWAVVAIGRGGVGVRSSSLPATSMDRQGGQHYHATHGNPRYPYSSVFLNRARQPDWRWAGFQVCTVDFGSPQHGYWFWVVPCWFLFLLTLILPLVVMVRRRRRARAGFEVLPAPAAPTCGPSWPP